MSILNKNNVKSYSSSTAHNARNFNKDKDNACSSPLTEEGNTYVRMHYSLITQTEPQNMTLCNIKQNLKRKETAHYRQCSTFYVNHNACPQSWESDAVPVFVYYRGKHHHHITFKTIIALVLFVFYTTHDSVTVAVIVLCYTVKGMDIRPIAC